MEMSLMRAISMSAWALPGKIRLMGVGPLLFRSYSKCTQNVSFTKKQLSTCIHNQAFSRSDMSRCRTVACPVLKTSGARGQLRNRNVVRTFHTCTRSSLEKVGSQHRCVRSPVVSVVRWASQRTDKSRQNQGVLIYIAAVGIFMVGASYAAVPLYRMFCQATGLGGQAVSGHDTSKVEGMQAVEDRVITVKFNADTASSMQWNFRPQQAEVRVLPGETALAFYTAKNPTSKPIIGISTYNVVPFDAGQYFNKIQCFCFEEQRLNPHEEVDMPVFFYIDPEFAVDPKMEGVDQITLSYTFFEAKEGLELPYPGYATHVPQSAH